MKVSSKTDQPAKQFNISGGKKKKRQRAILDKGGGDSTDYRLLAGCHAVHIFTFLNSTYPMFS